MAAYVIVEIEVTDPVGYEEYKKQAAATVHKYGGKYIVRGGRTEVLEGDWEPKRIVILQFDSMERAKEWLNCEEYPGAAQDAPPHRQNQHAGNRRSLTLIVAAVYDRRILIFNQDGEDRHQRPRTC